MANNKKRALAVAAAASMAATLAACGGGSDDSSSGSKGGTLYYYINAPVEHLDPQRTYVGRDLSNMSRTVYRSLVTFPVSTDPEKANTPVADLATDTGKSSNGAKTWQFTLRDGVTWQDGKAVTCDDLKYGASRSFATDVITGGPNYLLSKLDIPADKDGSPAYKGPYTKQGQALFDKAVTCDGKTITYRFKQAWPDFPLAIASLHMMDPYRQDQDKGNKNNLVIFSNGPYKLKGTWNKQSGGTLVRNSEYKKSSDSTDTRKALPDQIQFKIGDSIETIYDRLISDSGDDKTAVTGNRLPPSYLSRTNTPGVKDRYVNVESPYVDYLVPNLKRPALKNVKVREALALSTDQKGWITAGGGDKFYSPAKSIVNPNVNGYKDNPNFKEFDPAAAKKMLDSAGVKTPVSITFQYQKTDTMDKQAAALKQGWEQAGFKVTLDGLGDTYYDVIQKPDNDGDVIWGGWGADWPSAITVTPALFDSRPNLSSASTGQDYGNYKSDAFNKLVDQAANAADLDQQTKALQEGDALLGKDVAYIPLEISKFNWLYGSDVKGFTTTPASNAFPDLGPIGVDAK